MYSGRSTCRHVLHRGFHVCAAVAGTQEPIKNTCLTASEARRRVVQSKRMRACLRSRLCEGNQSMCSSSVSRLRTISCSWFSDWTGTISRSYLPFATEAFALTFVFQRVMYVEVAQKTFHRAPGVHKVCPSLFLCPSSNLSSLQNLTTTLTTSTESGFRQSHSFDTSTFLELFTLLAAGSLNITQSHHADPHSDFHPSSSGLSFSYHTRLSSRRQWHQ